ncbi:MULTISPECIES: ferrochelatase [Flavobacterium]|uniref:ferrochelatase n=1 Tax=Flavobacterium TaxID=237 RepID=UPI00086DBFB6|nr:MULTISPECIES: ferrochelatase [Flavobacterium]MBN9283380.1 ferrochelatase [Flavobacterium sp.]ODS87080.1 MAG: ferrochelatase [Chryseobacterium sp. SCN 40-13]OJV69496.1 MAG: ferrochelatase [Flavobacterium sp. 40-81]
MKGVLLVNLGSPESPEPKDVKPYLDEFLMDKYVIDVPFLLRALLVRGIILRKRPERSAEAYKKIWWEEGSPLVVISKRAHKKVQDKVAVPVALAMRYGNPSILKGLQELADKGVTEVMLFPLYPQHAMASTTTILVLAEELRQKHFPQMTFTIVPAFYNKKDYIQNLADSIKKHLEGFEYDHLLFSYHGIPERHVRKTDVTKSHCKIDGSCCNTPSPAHEFCYRHQCYETTRQVVELLNLPKEKYSQTFQSRLAGDKWLEPYTDVEINKMPEKGIKNLAVVTPAFVSDCLETLEEIAMEANHQFKEHGGENFLAIPCLNDDDNWIETMSNWIKDWSKN